MAVARFASVVTIALLCMLAATAQAAEGRVVTLEGQVGPYWEQQDLHLGGQSFKGQIPLRANESFAVAVIEIEDRAAGWSDGYVFRFCDKACPLDHNDPFLARGMGLGPFVLEFNVSGLEVIHYRASVDDGARADAHVTGTVTFHTDDVSPSSARTTDTPFRPTPLAVALGLGIVSAVAVLPTMARPAARWVGALPVAALFTRKEALLEHPVRQRLHQLIRDHPGIHLRELRRALSMTPGQVDHHLQKLVHGGYVVTHTVRGYTAHFVPGAVDRDLMAALARVKSDAARTLLATIGHGGCLTLGAAAEEIGIGLSTASYHMGCLERLGLVEVRANGTQRWRVTALGRSFLDLVEPETGSGSRTGPGTA